MRILSLTAGAAGMYCGTCLRDNSLARELIRQGHDVLLVPIYTPTLTEEENVSAEKVFFGGISVYLQQHYSIFRKLPAFFDRLWDSNWALKLATSGSISVNPKLLGEMTVSMLRGEQGFQAREISKLTSWLVNEPRPDVIDLPYTLLIALAEPLKNALQRPVICTMQGEDLFLEGLQEPWHSECLRLIRANLRHVDRFIAVSEYYASFMSEYLGLERSRIEVSPLGISMEGHDASKRSATRDGALQVGFFARVAPEKGLHVLAEAVSLMKQPAVLRAAGYLPPEHKGYLQKLRGVQYEGSPDRAGKIAFLQSIDVFSMPSPYADPKGLSLLEAMANGVPVVQPSRGAFPEIVRATGGGVLFAPDTPQRLAEVLDELAADRDRLRALSSCAAQGVRDRYGLAAMASRTAEIYQDVARGAAVAQS
ncbi:MAG TPA: glycosyltransferase family 4 protein [Bryobacteraceae bacterium]|nr:glycosyltransferase family 4 protein [Bryobacteraceae bacterium]